MNIITIYETEEKPFFVVQGNKLLQVNDRVFIEYLDGDDRLATVIASQSSNVSGNVVTIEFDNEDTDHFEYELIG